jgi:hypothetical protein
MSESFSATSLVGALANASSYTAPMEAGALVPVPEPVAALIRLARVELFCDHTTQGVAAIRDASAQLRALSGPLPGAVLAALDEASWFARHDNVSQAERALERALLALAGLDAVKP